MLFLYDLIKDTLNSYARYVERMVMNDDTPLFALVMRIWFLLLLPMFILIGTSLLLLAVFASIIVEFLL